MTEVVLTNVAIKSWIVYPYVDGLLDGPGQPLILPAYDVATGVCGVVPCLLYVYMDLRGLLKVFLVSLPKGPCCLPYVLLIASYVVALEALITPLFLSLGSWSLGFMRTCFIVVFPLKYICMPYLPHVFLKLSTSPCVYGMTTYPMVDFGLEMVVVTVLTFGLLLNSELLLLSPVCVCWSMLLERLLLVSWRLLLLESS